MKIHNICSSFEILDNQILIDNEKQFIKYIDVTVRNVYIDYLRTKVENKETLIENTDSMEEKIEVFNDKSSLFEGLTKDEVDFLNLFIEKGETISLKKVAEKIGISKQAVHKRIAKIRNKITK